MQVAVKLGQCPRKPQLLCSANVFYEIPYQTSTKSVRRKGNEYQVP